MRPDVAHSDHPLNPTPERILCLRLGEIRAFAGIVIQAFLEVALSGLEVLDGDGRVGF